MRFQFSTGRTVTPKANWRSDGIAAPPIFENLIFSITTASLQLADEDAG
jgi:hypothetical protein